MKYILILIIISNLLYSDNNVSDKDKILAQQLFEKVFKKKSKENKLYLPLKINNILQNEIFVKIDENEYLFISKDTIEYLLSLLQEKFKNQFIYKGKEEEFYPLSTLNQLGIIAKYDRENILINIYIPSKLKKASLLNFNRVRNKDTSGAILPEKYAGGANFYLNKSYTGTNNLKESSLSGSSDVFLNIHDTILEGRFQYQENSSKKIVRDRFRLLRDDEENQLRYTLGDIILPRQYRMGFTDALGVTIEKKFEINRDFSQNISRISTYS
jgi:outer membrane usher protein